MNRTHPLPSFSQPQAVFVLLMWLRLLACGLLFLFTLMAGQWIEAIRPLIHWPLFLILLALTFFLNGVALASRRFVHQGWHLFITLLLDSLLWFALIWSSGGALNPATSYLLVLLAVAALSLNLPQAVTLLLLDGVLYALLLNSGTDSGNSHHNHGQHSNMLNWHLQGMWVLFLMTAMTMMAVIWLLGKKLREKEQAIARYREDTVRNEQLVAMGTLAANLAHELGSPLSTIMILAQDIPGEDGEMLRQQAERCRQVLTRLKFADSSIYQAQQLDSQQLFHQLQQEMLLLKPAIQIQWLDEVQQTLLFSPLLKQALLALLNNAADACRQQVTCRLYRQQTQLHIDIYHDGAAINPDLLQLLGQQRIESPGHGLGIGYFLANASIEHCGGTLLVSNLPDGVLTRVSLPAERIIPDA